MKPSRSFFGSLSFFLGLAGGVVAPYLSAGAQPPDAVVAAAAADKRVQLRSYTFSRTGEELPYALFVPSNYDPSKDWPLVVGLHGAGRPYNWMMGYEGMVDFAERHGFILVTPHGYHPFGFFGSELPSVAPADERLRPVFEQIRTLPPNISELAEADVMNVVAIVRREFNVDPNRVYLFGHSMGGGGAFHLAARYPDLWAGIAVAAPYRAPNALDLAEDFKGIPMLLLQGNADDVVLPSSTRELVERMRDLRMNLVYVEIPGGDHNAFMSHSRGNLSRVFSFFDVVSKSHQP